MRQYFAFSLAGERFAFDVAKAVEVVRAGGRLRPVPDLPAYVAGVAEVRGEVVPVMDLRLRFSMPTHADKKRQRLLIVKTTLRKIGLLVDSADGLMKLEESGIEKPPLVFRGLKSEYLGGLVRKEGDVVAILNIDEIVNSDEKIALETAMADMKKAGRA